MWGRLFGNRNARAPETAQPAEAQRQTITLRPMTEAEYEHLRSSMDEDYAQEVAKAMAISIEEGRAAAQKQLDDLLKDGLRSEGHYLWKILSDDGNAVGDLWVLVEPAKQRAFIYFISIDEPYRGKGYGRAAMRTLEAQVKPMGAQRIDLNVFGDNATAIHLYQSLGYQTLGMGMRKAI